MQFFDNILYPLKWVVAWIMVGAHDALTFLGMESSSGWTWVLSIVFLVIVIRIILIPLFVKQIKASRGMQILQPDMQKIQKKYKGKTDPASRQAMQQEMMALYREHGTTPFASCLPILAQMPIFFALFRVLWSLPLLANGTYQEQHGRDAIGGLTQALAIEANESTIFGASLSETFLRSGELNVQIVSVVLIIMMSMTMLFTQRQLTMKNMPASAMDNPMARQQRMLMYILPVVFAVTGVNFPIGVLIYWTTTNVWSMGQQWYVIRNNPTPGSEAYKRWEERKARKAERKGKPLEDDVEPEPEQPRGQRQQPMGKARAKKAGTRPNTPGAADANGAVNGEANHAIEAGESEQAADAESNGESANGSDVLPGQIDVSNKKQNAGGKPGSNKKRKKRKKKSRG